MEDFLTWRVTSTHEDTTLAPKLFSLGDVSCADVHINIQNRDPPPSTFYANCPAPPNPNYQYWNKIRMDNASDEVIGIGGTTIRVLQTAALRKKAAKSLLIYLTYVVYALRLFLVEIRPEVIAGPDSTPFSFDDSIRMKGSILTDHNIFDISKKSVFSP
jgi:hypothetical protein